MIHVSVLHTHTHTLTYNVVFGRAGAGAAGCDRVTSSSSLSTTFICERYVSL